jgi:hypothetical protein
MAVLPTSTGPSHARCLFNFLAARVEQPREPSSLRVEPRDVRAFVKVVVHAREGKILVRCLPTMLLGDDVIQRECEIRDNEGESPFFTAPGSAKAEPAKEREPAR